MSNLCDYGAKLEEEKGVMLADPMLLRQKEECL